MPVTSSKTTSINKMNEMNSAKNIAINKLNQYTNEAVTNKNVEENNTERDTQSLENIQTDVKHFTDNEVDESSTITSITDGSTSNIDRSQINHNTDQEIQNNVCKTCGVGCGSSNTDFNQMVSNIMQDNNVHIDKSFTNEATFAGDGITAEHINMDLKLAEITADTYEGKCVQSFLNNTASTLRALDDITSSTSGPTIGSNENKLGANNLKFGVTNTDKDTIGTSADTSTRIEDDAKFKNLNDQSKEGNNTVEQTQTTEETTDGKQDAKATSGFALAEADVDVDAGGDGGESGGSGSGSGGGGGGSGGGGGESGGGLVDNLILIFIIILIVLYININK